MIRPARLIAEAGAVVLLGLLTGVFVGVVSGWAMQTGIRRGLFIAGGIGLAVWWLFRRAPHAGPPRWTHDPPEQGLAPDGRSRELEAIIRRAQQDPGPVADVLRRVIAARGGQPVRDDLARFLAHPVQNRRMAQPATVAAWIRSLGAADG